MTEPAQLDRKGRGMKQGAKEIGKEGGKGDTLKVIFQALLIALVVRTFLFQPFNIPSGSMIPTLLIGDYLFVSKYTYGYSCLLYTSDAADEEDSVDLGGRRII